MSKRLYCSQCLYPQSVCLCHAVQLDENKVKVIVLQHPSESAHAKNTARLLKLGLKHCEIICGESAADFNDIRQRVSQSPQDWAVLYPSQNSLQLSASHPAKSTPACLILLDGTWKKAFKIWQLNPWLHSLTCYQLQIDNPGIYQRKAKWQNSLSTLECCAFALDLFEGLSPTPLSKLLQVRQSKLLSSSALSPENK
ncbi:tRNA-uridine aminocarboxypropyltransferase [Neptunicella marina]|uniref:tRNA-uridine aminocarboxypropyltransferase n=1 Tax=Neptunicella marina TaxID=2125989 RepID=A0A8J6ISL0_9ALTE|nr:tRNA-uridine aminocarboxypropyltransferase [Neptunicella marina]MBC3766690.1 DTW domain-containing protein [Neptunicella marina]